MSTAAPLAVVPPPWQLTGSAVVLVYRFPRRFVIEQGGLAAELGSRFVGGLGAVACIDYHTSDVGAYRELLFSPGQLRIGARRRWTISRIYVSTATSAANGIRNWAIPKRLAQFRTDNATHVVAGCGGTNGFILDVRPFGPALPADSRWLPVAAELAQSSTQGTLITRPRGRGAVRLARVQRLAVDAAFFPDVSRFRPLLALYVPQFALCFPPAKGSANERE